VKKFMAPARYWSTTYYMKGDNHLISSPFPLDK